MEMINLDDFEKGTVKLPDGIEEPGYYNRKTKTFIPQERFIEEVLDSYRLVKKENKRRDKEIEKLKKTVKFERQKNNEKYSSVREEEYKRGQKSVCRYINQKCDLYQGEPILHEFYIGYSNVIRDLQEKGIWRI